MDTTANGGIQLIIGDGTNTIGYDIAGSDVAAFRHSTGPVGWQCLIIDTSLLPAGFTVVRGTEASLDLTAVTEIGAQFKTLSKALGGASNCFIDVIRRDSGQQGISITGGASGTPGRFSEIAADDRSATSLKAYGIIREVGSNVFGVQGSIIFGNTGAHWFDDQNAVVVWEDRNLDVDKYKVTLAADGAGISHFQLGDPDGTDSGKDGCSLIVPTGVGGELDLSDPDFDEVEIYGSLIQGWDQGTVAFSDNATNGINHEVFATSFIGCATINPGRVSMRNCDIVASAATSALLLDDADNTLWQNNNFVSDGTGHAIEITFTGAGPHTLTLTGMKYSGYASIDGSTGNEVILYNPGTTSADITITIAGGGDTPTVMKAAGVTGTVTIVNNKTITFDKMKDNTEVWVFPTGVRGEGNEIAHIEDATAGTADDRSFAWTAAGGAVVDYFLHNFQPGVVIYEEISVIGFTVPNVDTTIDIQQRIDRNVQN
jgi:hypothetical protein